VVDIKRNVFAGLLSVMQMALLWMLLSFLQFRQHRIIYLGILFRQISNSSTNLLTVTCTVCICNSATGFPCHWVSNLNVLFRAYNDITNYVFTRWESLNIFFTVILTSVFQICSCENLRNQTKQKNNDRFTACFPNQGGLVM